MALRRIGFSLNPHNEAARLALDRAEAWCTAHHVESWNSPSHDADAISTACPGTDLVCVLGGDGTFLRTAQAIGDSGVPALGVNLGRVGFLAKIENADLERVLDQVHAGQYTVEDRFRIEATVIGADGSSTHACLNEVVVATPTGSTAYSFSAGGAVLDPRLRNMIITPVAGYLSPLHSVVAGERHVVRLTLRDAHQGAIVSVDGQTDLPISPGDRVEVRALPAPLRLIEPEGSTPFYDLLRTKASLLPY